MIASSIQMGPLSHEAEAELIVRIKAGEQAACTTLVKLFTPRMMAAARRFLSCEDDCNDAVQDAFISAFRAMAGFEAQSRLSTWLHRITVNSCLMKLRSSTFRNEKSMDDWIPAFLDRGKNPRRLVDADEPSTEIESGETRAVVRMAIEQLPDAFRQVVLLRDIEELSTAQTAARLEITENNVKRRLHRARRMLGLALGAILYGGMALSG